MAVTSLPAPLAIKGSARNRQNVRLTGRSTGRAGHAKNRLIPITGRSIGVSQFFYKTYLCELVLGFLPDWNQTSAEIFSGEGISIIVKKS